jgi:hypothetical protein
MSSAYRLITSRAQWELRFSENLRWQAEEKVGSAGKLTKIYGKLSPLAELHVVPRRLTQDFFRSLLDPKFGLAGMVIEPPVFGCYSDVSEWHLHRYARPLSHVQQSQPASSTWPAELALKIPP